MFGDPPQLFVFALDGANPKPRQNHVDGDVSRPRRAEHRLRFRKPRRTKGPMPRPKIITLDLQDLHQRIHELPVWMLRSEPRFEPGNQVARRQPMCGESEASWRVVCRKEAVEAPRAAGQNKICEFFALAPPLVPDGAEIFVRSGLAARQFGGKQSADAEQSRLTFHHFARSGK